MLTILCILVWLGCGVLHYGMVLAYFQRGWPRQAFEDRWDDWWISFWTSLFGPLALGAFLFFLRTEAKHRSQGFLWHCLTPDEVTALAQKE